jgi:hypothetical protein
MGGFQGVLSDANAAQLGAAAIQAARRGHHGLRTAGRPGPGACTAG